ncbi:carbon monoxide dehydrogenase [Streptomyces sp. PSKA54]|uniref:Carbon monoxide dehydrogenase n=1 Tax=Streptomyces himalayensis subsp. aureolus TaxID=2758039 RepID=A0A7W2CXG5_9ACTN|nr:SRPBCC domain-containing protein [Streptomyces himalayensis]MBA4860922.1 carbon monoxide dehydrogenase [Streptomyces himalayensis subsp. aureolus]
MEHEVFVPVPVEPLREVLGDPARVARAVPGLQQDAGEPPVSGRLKVRIGGHTITYRGALRLSGQADGSYAVEGEATEARGTGGVKLALMLVLTPTDGGTTLTFTTNTTVDGRAAELSPESVESAARRLLNRFGEGLGAGAAAGAGSAGAAGPASEVPGASEGAEGTDDSEGAQSEGAEGADDSEGAESEGAEGADDSEGVESESAGAPGPAGGLPEEAQEPEVSVFEAEVPPSSLDPFVEQEEVAAEEPPAEAAHARRTMIGRSAEEVDHAPPRGRYAPVPAPESISTTATLRWVAPAAALVVASAIVVTRALRRRR